MIGSTITFLPLLGNLKFHPEIPWAFPMTVAVLAVYGAYFSGWGPPAGTRLIALCAPINNRTGNVAQLRVFRRPISNLRNHWVDSVDKCGAHSICLRQPDMDNPIKFTVTP